MNRASKRSRGKDTAASNEKARINDLIQRIFSNCPFPIMIVDSKGCIVGFNAPVETLSGYSRTEIDSFSSFFQLLSRLIPEDMNAIVAKQVQKIIADGSISSHHNEFAIVNRSGEKRIIDCSIFDLPSGNGTSIYYVIQGIDITEKKSIEDGHKLLKSAIEQSREGVALFGLSGNILYVNSSYSAMHGYKPDELTDRHISIFHTPHQMTALENSLRTARKKSEFIGEIGHIHKSGYEFPTLSHITLLRNDSGGLTGYIFTSQDITESKRNEIQRNALRRIRNQILTLPPVDSLFNLMKLIGSCLKTVEIPYSNAEIHVINEDTSSFALRTFRLGDEVEVKDYSKEPSIQVLKTFWESGVPVYRRDLEADDVYHERETIQRYMGSIRSVLDIPYSHGTLSVNSTKPNAFSQEDIIFLRELAQILSEGFQRAEDQQKLAMSESLYRSLVETPTNMIVLRLQADGRILYLSPQIRHLTGFDPRKLQVKRSDIRKLIHPDDFPRLLNIFKRVATGKTIKNQEFRWLSRTGEWCWAQETSFPVYDADGNIAGIQFVIFDITERKRMEVALQESESKNKAILDAIPDSMYRISTDGTIIDFKGKQDATIDSFRPGIGQNIAHIFPKISITKMLSHIDRALHEGFDAFEYQIPVNGAKHSFETRMVRHTDSEVIAIIRNVTERKRREDQRNALQLLRREVLNMHGVDDINTVLAVLKKLLEDVGINFKDGCINIIDNVENLSVIAHPLTIDQKWRHTVIPEAAGIIFQIWRDGEPYYRRDLDESDVYNERIHLQSLWKEARSVIDIPFSHGTLSLYNSIPDAFPKDDILFLQDVSQILSEGFRRAEDLQQLALSESRYRTLVETPLNQVVVLITASGNIIYISPQITDLTGYGPEEFSANPSLFRQCFDPVDIRRILRLYCKALHGKLSPDHEIDIFHKNGDRRWVSMNSIPIVGKSSEIEAIQFIIHNITDLKNAEQALRDSEERYQHLYDYSPDIYFTVAKDGSILSVNRFGLDSLGYDRDEIVGRKIWTLAANTEQEQVYDKITAIFADRIMNMELECRLQKKDGTLFWVQELTNLIIDDNNYPSELRVSCRDITDRIMAEEQIQKSLEEKEILLKEIHHRVKNNMQVISSLLALQKERISDEFYGAMFKESINRIQTMALIHELLYRSDNFSQIDFKEYVSRIGSYLSNLYNTQSGGVFLTTDVDDIFLKLDVAIPCGLVINELISNAYKYAFIPSGNGVLTVSMKQKEPSSILLVVADDGCGMPQDFDIDTTESLGLKMVKLLVEYQLGGKLYLKKTPGTTFTIEFTV